MLIGFQLAMAAILAVALVLASTVDVAFSSARKVNFRRLLDSGNGRRGQLLMAMLDNRVEVLMAVHIGIQLMLIVDAILLTGGLIRSGMVYPLSLASAAGAMLLVVLLFRHLIPRMVAGRYPERVLLGLFPVVRLLYVPARPFARLLISLMGYFQRWEAETAPEEEQEASEEEIQAFIDVGEQEGILEGEEGELVQSIVHFGDKVVREVMTPRPQIVAIEINSTAEVLRDFILAKKHSRVVVFRDHLDNIEGVVFERDLLQVWRTGEKLISLRTLLKPVSFVPETKPVHDLLQEMKRDALQIALVVDEYGGISGLVTIEDLVEEIVGDIRDESESERMKIVVESDGVLVVPGGLELGVFDDRLGTPFLEGTASTTVAGAVLELFGRLPAVGESIEHQGVLVEVLDADRRQVHRLRFRLLSAKKANT